MYVLYTCMRGCMGMCTDLSRKYDGGRVSIRDLLFTTCYWILTIGGVMCTKLLILPNWITMMDFSTL